MNICRRFIVLICGGLLASAALYGCGGSSSDDESIPSTVTIFNAHSVIFGNNSTLMTMGYNDFGQLGDGTRTSRAVPTVVPNLGRMTKAVAGAEHTLAFGNATTVMAWGYNVFGQVGNALVLSTGGQAFSSKPVKVSLDGTTVTDIAAGSFHSLAVAGGNIWAWGYNGNGQAAPSSSTSSANPTTPVKVEKDANDVPLAPGTVVKVAAGGLHSMALIKDGGVNSVYAWGDNSFGQLGFSPDSTASKPRPIKVPFPATVGTIEDIAAGGRFSLALDVIRDINGKVTGQTLWGWGYNSKGELALDPAVSTNDPLQYTPRPVFSVTTTDPLVIKKFSAGVNHILLLLGPASEDLSSSSWIVRAIGYNYYGQLGNDMAPSPLGNSTTNSSFEFVYTLNTASALTGVQDIRAFGFHSLARGGNGAWYGWGNNIMGQLGSPVPASSAGNPKIPVLVQVP